MLHACIGNCDDEDANTHCKEEPIEAVHAQTASTASVTF